MELFNPIEEAPRDPSAVICGLGSYPRHPNPQVLLCQVWASHVRLLPVYKTGYLSKLLHAEACDCWDGDG